MNTVLLKNAQSVEMYPAGTGYDLFVNGETTHINDRHTLSRQAKATDCDNVVSSIIGGHFVFEDNKDPKSEHSRILREFRYNDYNGFIQSQDFVDRFGNDLSLKTKREQTVNFSELGAGGEFTLYAGFDWSAFSPTLRTAVQIMRLICENGNKVRHDVLQKDVPIINMFDSHIGIAAEQTLDATRRLLGDRFVEMAREVASVRSIQLTQSHVEHRLKKSHEASRLHRIKNVLNSGNFENFYTANALDKTAITTHLPSHLSKFDLYNIITEVASHTDEVSKSTKNALDKMASDVVFKLDDNYMLNDKKPARQTFGSPELAFFG